MALAQARYGFLLRSIPVEMAGKFSATMTAEALVVFAAALYLGFDTKVNWPGAAFSMPAFRALAMSDSFMAVSRGIVACQVSGLRCQVSGKTKAIHFTVNPRTLFLRPKT